MVKKVAIKKAANCGKSSTKTDIYVLLGDSQCGKSSTIKEIYRILSIKYKDCIILRKFSPPGYDMKVKIKIKVGAKEILVGIDSFGDTDKRIEYSLNDFVKKGCNIIFCAENLSKTKNTSSAVQWANSNSQNIKPVKQKTVTHNQSQTNYNTAQKIISMAGL
jgi:hypothetical protein